MQLDSIALSSQTASRPLYVGGTAPAHRQYFGIGFGVIFSAGAVLTVKVQHTFQDPEDVASTWFDHPYVTGITSNTDGNYAMPIRAMRLNCTAYTSGNATLIALGA